MALKKQKVSLSGFSGGKITVETGFEEHVKNWACRGVKH
jgi:hypothetical protein